MPTLTPCRRTWLICLGLIAVTVIAYWPVGQAGYISMDDFQYVSDNPVVQAGLTAHGFKWAFFADRVSNYHPLAWLSHMLDFELFGHSTAAQHRVNVLLHCASSVLLFLVVRRMTGREGCSLFVAAVFALHPQHVESVAWISERKDVLSAFFCMLTLWCYARYAEQPGVGRYLLVLAMYGLGLLSKPMLVTLPCAMLLLDFWPLRRTTFLRDENSPAAAEPLWRSLGRLVLEKVPMLLMAVGASVATMFAQTRGGAVITTDQIPVSMRIGNALVAYARYLKKFLWPDDLAAFYPLLRPWPTALVLGAAALLLVMTVVAVVLWRRKPYLAVGWLWFVGMLVPVIGLVQVGNQSMADRYVYLPMIGLTFMLAWAVAELVPWRAMQYAAGVLAIAGCTWVTADDVRYWKNSEMLFTRALERTERNAFALHSLAAAQLESGKTDLAIRNFEECARLQPGNGHVQRSLGQAYAAAGRYDDAHARFARAIEIDPKQARSWTARGSLYLEQQNWREAAEHFSVSLKLKPDQFNIWINYAVASRQMSDLPRARHALERAAEINPRAGQPWYMLGRLLQEDGKPAEAVEPLRRAVALEPSRGDAYYQLGSALMATGRGAEATEVLLAGLRHSPHAPNLLTKLAWLLATHPDDRLRRGQDAMMLANHANKLTKSSDPRVLDALAAAQAEQQQFAEAAATAAKGAELARAAGDVKLADQIESRAAKYRAHSAMRDASLAGTDAGSAIP